MVLVTNVDGVPYLGVCLLCHSLFFTSMSQRLDEMLTVCIWSTD